MDNKTDFIAAYPDAFSKEFCDSIVSNFEDVHAKGFTYAREDRSKLVTEDTSLDSRVIDEGDLKSFPVGATSSFNEVLFRLLEEYIEQYPALEKMGDLHSYSIKVQRTKPSQGYHVWHYEAATIVSRRRVLAYTLYLNTIEDGGETEFLYQRRRIKPQQGTLCLFPADFTHLHRGNPPLTEDKYIATGWIEI